MAELLHQPQTVGGIEPPRSARELAKVDARTRIVAALVFAIFVVSLTGYAALLAALMFALGIAVAASLPLARTLKRVAAMDLFIVFMLVMLPFTTPGDPMFSVAGFPASYEGLHRALGIGLKANTVLLFLLATVGTLESVQVGHALYRLGCPAPLVHILMFTVRYVDVLHQEFARLVTAMKARGFQPGNNRHTYKTYGYLIGMLLVRAMERSERILAAMKCRGFNGTIHVLDNGKLRAIDAWFGVALVFVLVALASLEWSYVLAH